MDIPHMVVRVLTSVDTADKLWPRHISTGHVVVKLRVPTST